MGNFLPVTRIVSSIIVMHCPPYRHGCSIRLLEINLAAVRNLISVLGISSKNMNSFKVKFLHFYIFDPKFLNSSYSI